MKLLVSGVFLFVFLAQYGYSFDPTDSKSVYEMYKELQRIMKNLDVSWEPAINFNRNLKIGDLKSMMGALLVDPHHAEWIKLNARKATLMARKLSLPQNFTVHDTWPQCAPSFDFIHSQGDCSSCWAVSPLSVLSDRVCIQSGGKLKDLQLSTQDVLECCSECGNCTGGSVQDAYDYLKNHGVVSGSDFIDEMDGGEGCKPYLNETFVNQIDPNSQSCREVCQDGYDVATFEEERAKYRPTRTSVLTKGEEEMQSEIFSNGPISSSMKLYSDFLFYGKGVYKHVWGNQFGNHHLKIIGWGVEYVKERNRSIREVPYWLAANTWGTDFGHLKGFIKIERGVEDLKFEENAYAPLVESMTVDEKNLKLML